MLTSAGTQTDIRSRKEAQREYNKNPDPKFYNKKYYNPEYHYYTEAPDVVRLYSQRDNTEPHHDFTDVLDNIYLNVYRH